MNTPNNTPNSSNSSIESIICYNVYISNTIPNANANTNTASPLILYTCKFCSNK